MLYAGILPGQQVPQGSVMSQETSDVGFVSLERFRWLFTSPKVPDLDLQGVICRSTLALCGCQLLQTSFCDGYGCVKAQTEFKSVRCVRPLREVV